MMTREEAQNLAGKVIKLTDYPECEVNIVDREEAYTRFANNGITTASFNRRHSVSVTVSRDGQTGSYAVNDLDDASLSKAVKNAENLATIAPPNPERMPPLGPQQFPAVHSFDEATANVRSPEMIPHVKKIVDASARQKLVAAGLILRSHQVSAVANKAGLFGFHNAADSQLTTTVRIGCPMDRAQDGPGSPRPNSPR
jgi:predicted Zn-dependent protease